VYPAGNSKKRTALLVAALALLPAVAGCGGGGSSGTETTEASGQTVSGPGFVFQAPQDWTVKTLATSAEARQDPSTVVSVTVLPLLKPYRLALFPRVAKELDRVATTYAANTGVGNLIAGLVVSANPATSARPASASLQRDSRSWPEP